MKSLARKDSDRRTSAPHEKAMQLLVALTLVFYVSKSFASDAGQPAVFDIEAVHYALRHWSALTRECLIFCV